jgi:hypothetical protein
MKAKRINKFQKRVLIYQKTQFGTSKAAFEKS